MFFVLSISPQQLPLHTGGSIRDHLWWKQADLVATMFKLITAAVLQLSIDPSCHSPTQKEFTAFCRVLSSRFHCRCNSNSPLKLFPLKIQSRPHPIDGSLVAIYRRPKVPKWILQPWSHFLKGSLLKHVYPSHYEIVFHYW